MLDTRGRAAYMGAVLILIVLVHMAGCASLGPRTLQRSHINYNKAVQKAQMEEDLLNIVRLRYFDMPAFLSVSSISAQPSFSVGTSGEFGLVEGESSANITPDINYTIRGQDMQVGVKALWVISKRLRGNHRSGDRLRFRHRGLQKALQALPALSG